jgi:hypothetical protein
MMRLLKRLLSVVRDRAKVMVDLDKTGRELDKRSPARRRSSPANPNSPRGYLGDSLRRSSKSKVLRKDPG